jgi:REP element-mobilizing transposase RayT
MTRSRYRIVENDYPYFLTCTVVGWLPVFTRPEAVQFVLDSWKFLQDRGRLRLFGFVVMENHLHVIARSDDLSKEIGDFKSFTARQIIDHLQVRGERLLLEQLQAHKELHKGDRPYQLWQEGSHPQQIRHDEVMEQKLNYIHYNPVKHGVASCPHAWKPSSFGRWVDAGIYPADWGCCCTQADRRLDFGDLSNTVGE